ncbi:ARM repeat-containing protein [Rhizopus microsporus var. microsporus]|uniref:ARM repeat-containing protein n=1 Tax=Rhizopus microsporus var. microsporus TaxID=86635 RepID=A0A1X0RCN3_RHIZD|nr:ARM repeat-containing protein [Rhizopus microsporus var. microsporus]
MGKEQIRKAHKPRTNPLGVRVTGQHEIVNPPIDLHPDQVLPVIQKLSSPDATERAWAAASISNLIVSSSTNLKLLLSKGAVVGLIKLLSDEKREVVEEALGTLRNLCTVELDVCQEYVQYDILTPLSKLLPNITAVINDVIKDTPLRDEEDQDRRMGIWDVAENFICIIWSLGEFSENYVEAINQLNLAGFLISFLSFIDQCPTRVVTAAGQCLTTLTEDNKEMQAQFQAHPEYTQALLITLQKFAPNTAQPLVYVLASATLMNIRHVLGQSQEELNNMILPILISSLDYDIQTTAEETKAVIQSGKLQKDEMETKPSEPLNKEEVYIQGVTERLATLQLALELLAAMCSQDDSEEDGWEDADEAMDEDEEEEEKEENLELELNETSTSVNVDEEKIRSSPVVKAFTIQVFPHLIRLATPTCLSFPVEPSVITQGLTLTHQRALECLNNFLLAMSEIPSKFWFKEQNADAVQAWRWLFNMAHTVASAPDSEHKHAVLETIVGCLWCLGRGLGQHIPLEPNDVTSLCAAFDGSNSESMQVKIVGCLGAIASRQGDVNTNKNIGLFIMNILNNIQSQKTTPDVAVEALNFMFDVYSDCSFDYDVVYVQGQFNDQLKQLLPFIKSMVKSVDKRKKFDLRHRCDEALMNLEAFIKYKSSERK